MSFAEQLYNARTKNNMTQEELAEKLDISLSKLYRWESGQSTPNIPELKNLCLTFNQSPDYFLEWKTITPETEPSVMAELQTEIEQDKNFSKRMLAVKIVSGIGIFFLLSFIALLINPAQLIYDLFYR